MFIFSGASITCCLLFVSVEGGQVRDGFEKVTTAGFSRC
jgi:hypothetical protein